MWIVSITIMCNIFFFNDTATTEIYTLSLHDALPIYTIVTTAPLARSGAAGGMLSSARLTGQTLGAVVLATIFTFAGGRSEEHTSELQSRPHLVCRLLLDKTK